MYPFVGNQVSCSSDKSLIENRYFEVVEKFDLKMAWFELNFDLM